MRRALVPNPPWVNTLLAKSYDAILHGIQSRPEWMPQFKDVRALGSSGRVTAVLSEYGCGAYGCVFPTLDPRVVLKVTTDDTEAQFARDIAQGLERPICVNYYSVMEMDAEHDGRTVFLLWRESADRVGEIYEYLHEIGRSWQVAKDLITEQWDAAQDAFKALRARRAPIERERAVAMWLEACEAMARQTVVPELRSLGEGLVEVYRAQHVFFGDIHSGNIGMVGREEPVPGYGPALYPRWVITDPGHVAVVEQF